MAGGSTHMEAGKPPAKSCRNRNLLPIAMTQGDPSGIGPELTLLAWRNRKPGDPPFFVLTDPDLMRGRARELNLDIECQVVESAEAAHVFERALPVVDICTSVEGIPGQPNPADAGPTVASIDRAVEAIAKGQASAMVTNPVTKASLYSAGFAHPGHTEFLGELAEKYFNTIATPVMMLWSPLLAVVPVTIHVPLADAIAQLDTAGIIETVTIAAAALKSQFGIANPRIAVSGLNPHAGEQGAMGEEDLRIIRPAITALVQNGIDVNGPLPADTMFHEEARAKYDAAVCMYHDQALIPVKTLAFDSAVNVTLGLPFIRTSPDHGTAYDIAGKGLASTASLIAALRLAGQLAAQGTAANITSDGISSAQS